MPYREIVIGNEKFVTRVPWPAIEEWLSVRQRNREIGYPDRPPDVDTPLLRAWIAHPNEVNKFALAASMQDSKEEFPVFTMSTEILLTDLEVEAKSLLSYCPDKEQYKLRRVVRTLDGETLADSDYFIEDEEIEKILEEEQKAFAKMSKNEIMITTYAEYDEMQKESLLAEQELRDYYGEDQHLIH